MRTFALPMLFLAFCGCGDGVDPKLCALHAEQARLKSEDNQAWAAVRHGEIDKQCSDKLAALAAYRSMSGEPTPVWDCPKCDKLQERMLLERGH